MEQSTSVLVVIEFVEVRHTELDLSWQRTDDLFVVFGIIWPVTSCQYLHVEIETQTLGERCISEFIHSVLTHFDVLEHDLKFLSVLESALLFKFENELSLSIFEWYDAACAPCVKETLA
jgi:hypothetical protein